MKHPLLPSLREARPLLIWVKVLVVLVAADLAIWRSGLVWKIPVDKIVEADEIQLGEAHTIGRRLVELSKPGGTHERRVLITGSSLVEIGVGEEAVRAAVSARAPELGLTIYKMAEFGAFPSDVFIITKKALAANVDLVVYGASARDYPLPDFLNPRASAVAQILGADVLLEILSPRTFEESLTWQLRRHWLLYRYKPFFRTYVRWQYRQVKSAILERLVPPAHAEPNPRGKTPDQAPPNYRSLESFIDWLKTRKPEKYFESQRGINMANYQPEANPQLAVVAQWVRLCLEHDVHPVIIMMPENPLLTRARNPYFAPELSRSIKGRLKAIATRAGAGFHDLSSALTPEHFQDLNHPNAEGAALLSRRFAELIIEEARLASKAAPRRSEPHR